jgi:hypothetical protein
MGRLKYILLTLTVISVRTLHADNPCKECDIEKVKAVNDNINKLTLDLVKDFLCTFDSSCNNNAEYSEWSNETLFLVIKTDPVLFMDAVSRGKLNHSEIIDEIENPIHDLINLQQVYDSIKSFKGKSQLKDRYLNAIIVAGQKDGQSIKK